MAVIGNSATQQAFTPAIDYFSGNGSTTAFTLSRPVASVAQVQVTIDNVAQNPSSAYTVSANTITFTSAPLSGTNNIYVYYTSPITQVIAPGQGTVGLTALSATGTASASTYLRGDNSWAALISSQWTTTGSDIYYNTGNVGIGTTSPAYKLDVQGGTTRIYNATFPSLRIQNSATGTTSTDGLLVEMSGSDALFVNYESANMIFSTANTERMRIDSSGRVYSGSASPWTVGSGGVNSFALYGGADFPITGSSTSIVGIFNRITSTGVIVEFKYNANVNGSVSTNGSNVAYNTSSDYRLKENIAPMTGALAKVAQLKPVTYRWKINGSEGEGFIAHELAEVCPNAVTGAKDAVDKDGNISPQGIDTSFLVATLTAAIQELAAKNDALTARIVALENR
jgi:hypothetical protein